MNLSSITGQLHYVACGSQAQNFMMMTMRADGPQPGILIAYASCDECGGEATGEKALAAIRAAVREEAPTASAMPIGVEVV